MIHSAADIFKALEAVSSPESKVELLKEWAESIVDECGSTFRWEWDCGDEHDAVEIVDPDTIRDVKQQI